MSGAFDLARIAACGLIAQIDYHESIGSTSDRAIELAARGEAKLPLLVLAERQTAGRGRGTNHWWSDDGALTFSLVLAASPELLPAHRWPQVALIAGLAVCEALQPLAPRGIFQVKWPNDVFLDGRKVCGILSESVAGWKDRLVVGIGVNVNNGMRGTGDRGRGTGGIGLTATSLVEHDNIPRDLTDVLLAVLDELDRRWQELLYESFTKTAADYRQRCFLTGKTVMIEQPGNRTIVGVCGGISDEGALVLRTAGGEEKVVSGSLVRWEK